MLIRLLDCDYEPFWLNAEEVGRIYPADDESCYIILRGDDEASAIGVGEPAAEVAKRLVRALGFTSVDAVGFQMDSTGERELDSYGD